jgi:signal transduction histidine kinase
LPASNLRRIFVTNVSHELKTQITSIQGYAQAILDGTVLGEESIEQAATIIFNEANRMHGMVMDLLTWQNWNRHCRYADESP